MNIFLLFRRHSLLYITGFLALTYGVYICYHLFYGSGNIFVVQELSRHITQLEHRALTLTNERKHLEEEVIMLRPDSLNTEILEEKARQLLKLADEEDVVIIFKNE